MDMNNYPLQLKIVYESLIVIKIASDKIVKTDVSILCLKYICCFKYFLYFSGCYWVYKEYPPSYNPNDAKYCQKTAYKFAFVYITFLLAIMFIVLAGFMCFLGCICWLSKDVTVDVEAQTTVKTGEKDNEGDANGS